MTSAVYFGMLALVALLVLRRPSVALGAFLCTYGLEQWAQSRDGFFYERAALTNILTTCVLLWALLVRQLRGESILAHGLPRVFWVIAALFAWAAFSLIWTIAPDDAAEQWRSRIPYMLATILIMPLLVRDMDDLKDAFQMSLLLGGVVLLLLTVDSNWVGRQVVLRQGAAIGSVIGDRGSPLATASLAGWVALIALLMNYRGASRLWQLLRWPLVLLGLIVAFRSGSRGQLFAMVAAGLMFLPLSRRIRNIWGFVGTAFGVVLILVLATVAFDMYAYDASTRWNTDRMMRSWQSSRLEASIALLGAWADAGPVAWLIGLGTCASYDPNIYGFYPHVVMAETLGELGLIGFFLLWAVVIVGYAAYARLHTAVREDPVARGMAAAIAALFMFEIILSFKQGSLIGSVFAFGFAVVLGRVTRATLATHPYGYWPGGQMYDPAGGGGRWVAPFDPEEAHADDADAR